MSRLFLALSVLPAIAWAGADVAQRRHRHLARTGPLIPVLAALVALLVAVGLAWWAGANSLGMAHLGYLVATVGIPVGAAWVLMAELSRDRRARAGTVAAAAGLGGLLVAVGLYGTHVEPFRLSVERSELDVAGLHSTTLELAVYADPHMQGMTDHERDAWTRLLAEQPDIVLMPGDIFVGPFEVLREDVLAFHRMLAAAAGPVLAVAGDHDQLSTLEWMARDTDVSVLDDEVTVLVQDGVTVAVAGLDRDLDPGSAGSVLDALSATDADVRLVLAHDPSAVNLVGPEHTVDLVVAGDTHGGQVRLPLVGPLVNTADVPDRVALGGLHVVDGTPVYVSRGVGVARGQAPQVRLGAPPAVDVITLR